MNCQIFIPGHVNKKTALGCSPYYYEHKNVYYMLFISIPFLKDPEQFTIG